MTDIVTRSEAKIAGLSRYFTGKPCKQGHLSERSTYSAACLQCKCLDSSKRRLNDPSAKLKDALRRDERALQIKAYKKRYNDANRALIAETCRNWYLANSVKALASRKEYASKRPEIRRAIAQRRRARVAGVGGSYKGIDILKLQADQAGRCLYCRVDITERFEVDHIIPIALGGTNSAGNIQLLCMPCNRRKGAKHPAVWASEIAQKR